MILILLTTVKRKFSYIKSNFLFNDVLVKMSSSVLSLSPMQSRNQNH